MKSYIKVYEHLRDAIVAGDYPRGSRLPSKRALATEQDVSLITVAHAYDLLCQEGYVESRERSGFFAAYHTSDATRQAPGLTPTLKMPKPNRHRIPVMPPFSVISRIARSVFPRYGERIFIKSPNTGTPELREALAAYIGRTKAIHVPASQIVVGAGAEYLYGLVAQMFKEETVAVETPSYAKISQVYEAHGITVQPLRLGPNGVVSSDLAQTTAKLLHVTPYSSYPTGITADTSKRHEYVRWARERNGFIIEDDFAFALSAARRGAETLFSLDGGQRTIYISTFSKTFAPAIRAGYMVLPKSLMKLYNDAVGFYSCTMSVFEQFFLTDFLNSGAFERHIRRMRAKFTSSQQV